MIVIHLVITHVSSQCELVKRPWAPQPVVCIGCDSGFLASDGMTVIGDASSNLTQFASATAQSCLPCKVVLEGCTLCGKVQAGGTLRPYGCADSSTSSTAGEWPKPNGTIVRKNPPVVEVSNLGIHPGPIKFDKLAAVDDASIWTTTVCGSMEFAGFNINDGHYFECVCDSTCGIEHYGQSLGRCVLDQCNVCQNGWTSRGDYTMFTNCVVYVPIQTACWSVVIFTSIVILYFSFDRAYQLYNLRHLWRTYYATISNENKDQLGGDDDDVPISVAASMHCQDMFYLVWRHDDGFFLLLAMARSFVFLFFVSIPKVAIGQGSEVGFNRLVSTAYALCSVMDCVVVPEIIMLLLTKWTKRSIPRRNPYRLHVILELHKALDASYKKIRPILMLVSFAGPMVVLLVNVAFCNGTYGDTLETRIIPFTEQHALSILLSIFMRGQYICLASLQFWVSFQLFGRLLISFNTFASKVRCACNGLISKIDTAENNNNICNIINPQKTLKDINVAVVATRKLALLVLIFSSCLAGYYAAVVLLEPVRQRVSFATSLFVLCIDILTLQLILKIRPKPRRLNENHSSRRYIKVGDGLGGVREEEGTFDERVGDVVYKEKIVHDDDDDDYDDEDGLLCSCCDTKTSKAKRRRKKKERRRTQLREAAAAHHSAKVQPLNDAVKTRKTKTGAEIPLENKQLYMDYNIDSKLRSKFLTQFQKIDVDCSESIDFIEFAKYYCIIENATFVQRLFESFQNQTPWAQHPPQNVDTDNDGGGNKFVLYFQDYAIGLRQFLTMTKGQLILKAFELYGAFMCCCFFLSYPSINIDTNCFFFFGINK